MMNKQKISIKMTHKVKRPNNPSPRKNEVNHQNLTKNIFVNTNKIVSRSAYYELYLEIVVLLL
jgi:hypothetical protein